METNIEKVSKSTENIELSTVNIPVDEPNLSFSSTRVTCFVCHSTVLTEVKYKDRCISCFGLKYFVYTLKLSFFKLNVHSCLSCFFF